MVANFSPFRRYFCLSIAGMLVFLGQTVKVAAEAPMQKTQAPGYYRMMLGQFEITALLDGIVNLDAAIGVGP